MATAAVVGLALGTVVVAERLVAALVAPVDFEILAQHRRRAPFRFVPLNRQLMCRRYLKLAE